MKITKKQAATVVAIMLIAIVVTVDTTDVPTSSRSGLTISGSTSSTIYLPLLTFESPLPTPQIYWAANITGTKVVTISAWQRAVVNVAVVGESDIAAVEWRLALNPVVARVVGKANGDLMQCTEMLMKSTAGTVRYECRGEQLQDNGVLFSVDILGQSRGVTVLEPSGQWSTFLGHESGFGFDPEVRGLRIAVQ